jgi:hypothetical protein
MQAGGFSVCAGVDKVSFKNRSVPDFFMTENEIADRVMNASFQIHRELGPGLLESVYEVILARKLTDSGLVALGVAPMSGRSCEKWSDTILKFHLDTVEFQGKMHS